MQKKLEQKHKTFKYDPEGDNHVYTRVSTLKYDKPAWQETRGEKEGQTNQDSLSLHITEKAHRQ